MDATFTFPRPQAPVPRPAPASKASGGPQLTRESNALRASVLDAALELGLVSNPLVADWMFDNTLPEEDEEEVRFLFESSFFSSDIASIVLLSFQYLLGYPHSYPFHRGSLGIRAVWQSLWSSTLNRASLDLTPSLHVPQAFISSIKA
jgi:hypothetical protein